MTFVLTRTMATGYVDEDGAAPDAVVGIDDTDADADAEVDDEG